MIPNEHKNFITHATGIFSSDDRFVALLGAGSLITGNMDQYSDVDLVAVYKDDLKKMIMSERENILAKLGKLLSSFTGEHVGEPRVSICLYEEPLLHVDVKFLSLSELSQRIEDPVILFERNEVISEAYKKTKPHHPMPDLQWIEDRFWTWIHYSGLRLGRGELFEVLDMLSFIRGTVLGPLILVQNGELPRGVRKIEILAKGQIEELKETVAEYDKNSCIRAINAAIVLYTKLRDSSGVSLKRNDRAEKAAKDYLLDQ